MNELAFRQWLKEVGEVVVKRFTITDNSVDDQVAAMFFKAIESDLVWAYLKPIIEGMLIDETLVQASDEFTDACTATMVNPLTILAIVKALIDLYNLWKKG